MDERDNAYLELADDPEGNLSELQEMVNLKAMSLGFDFAASHGSAEGGIKVFDGSLAGKVQISDWAEVGTYFLPGHNSASGYAIEAVKRADPTLQEIFVREAAEAKKMGTAPMMKFIDRDKIGQENYEKLEAIETEWRNRIAEIYAGKAGPGFVYNVFLKIENPLIYHDVGMTDPFLGTDAARNGFDALVIINEDEQDHQWRECAKEIVIFDPCRVKSADPVVFDDTGEIIPLSQRFCPDSPDIRGSIPDLVEIAL